VLQESKFTIPPFLALIQGIQIWNYKLMSMQSKTPKNKPPGFFSPVLPLLLVKSTTVEQKKSMYLSFKNKTRVAQPAGSTTYQKNCSKI
jgi:hypothetical protein